MKLGESDRLRSCPGVAQARLAQQRSGSLARERPQKGPQNNQDNGINWESRERDKRTNEGIEETRLDTAKRNEAKGANETG